MRNVSNLKYVLIYNASARKQRPRERPSMLVVVVNYLYEYNSTVFGKGLIRVLT